MTKAPEVSLIMTTYNRELFLAAAIESVLAQTLPDFELIIWDDGSTDRSVSIAQAYSQQDSRVKSFCGKHLGIARAFNAGAAKAKSNYIGCIDSDDLLAPTALEATVTALEQTPQIGMIYTDYIIIDETGQPRMKGTRTQFPYSREKILLNFMTFHFRLIRRHLFEQVGMLDESLEYSVDYDLCLRLSEITEFLHLPQSLYFYRSHRDNISNNYERRIRQIFCSRQAILNALDRRGLSSDYDLEIQVDCRAVLRPKQIG
jgi:glycosyltransferase involved in cell wall biosynthesis